jgi:hypothetical protein
MSLMISETSPVHLSFFSLLALAFALLIPGTASAQFTRDAAANRKIDEAINVHYLATEFDKAEGVLVGTVKACEDKCSPQTLGRAWMYVGIVRGSGKNNIAGAKEAFQSALALDPSVKLDVALATAETQAAFSETAGGAVPVESPPVAPAGGEAAVEEAPAGEGLDCTPTTAEIETRRRIPVQCTSEEDATSMELRYKSFGTDNWKTVRLQKKGDSFRGEVPCDATQTAGAFLLYVKAKNAGGDEVGSWGSKAKPVEFQLVEQSVAEPPSFDDMDAPPRCAAKEECPPDFPGCGSSKGGQVDWGGNCESSGECKSGLLCISGTCESPPSCDLDSDCPNGKCVGGKCTFDDEEGLASGPFRQNYFGLHIAQDIAIVSGTDVCSLEGQDSQNFNCYYAKTRDQPFPGRVRNEAGQDVSYDPYPGVNIGSGTAVGTTRVLLSYDRAITRKILAGVRLGFAFNGSPPSGANVTYDEFGDIVPGSEVEGQAFFPFHVEARVSYYFPKNGITSRGFRPYVHAGGGLAEVDAKVTVPIQDCSLLETDAQRFACSEGTIDPSQLPAEQDLDGWKKLGKQFITLGGGVNYGIGERLGIQLNLNLMYMLPSTGLVLEPSLGMTFGM